MYLDNQKLHKDILKKLNSIKKSQRQVSKTQINISRATINRLSKNKQITLETFLKLLKWLEKDANSYIKIEKYVYKEY